MKLLPLLSLPVLFVLYAQPTNAQNYQQLPVGGKLDGGQAYILPKASLTIDLYIVAKEIKKGENFNPKYSDDQLKLYAKKYGLDLALYDALKKGTIPIAYSIPDDSIKITLGALPDFSKVFYTMPKKKWNIGQSTSFTYGNDGILTDAETTYENRTFDLVVKGMSGLASIVGSLFKGVSFTVDKTEGIEELDQILNKYDRLTTQYNYEVYKDVKSNLEKAFAKAFAYYFYNIKTTMKPAKLIYCPSAGNKTVDLFELSSTGDLSYNNTLGTEIIWAKNFSAATASLTKPFKIKMNLLNAAHQQKEIFNTIAPENSYFGYNVPAKTLISIINPDGKELGPDLYKIPQFGIVAYISAKKMNLVFQLDPMTGELKKLSTSSKAATDDQAGNAAAAVTAAITAAKGDDADTKLDKEVKRLENEKKKRDLTKELEEN